MKALWDLLAKVVTLVACALFLVSAPFPFLTVPYISIIEEDAYNVTYWSYMTTITYTKLGRLQKNEIEFFNNYWFAQGKPYSPPTPSELGVSSALVAMFLAQLLAMIVGLVSLFLRKWIVQIIPVISSPLVMLLMVYACVQAHKETYGLLSYQLGYWLTYPSVWLYLCAFILRLESARTAAIHKQ
jgi:hypothetical protein